MTDKKLKKDLNRYFRLAKKNFPLRYNSERIEIEDRAFEILNLFERGCLNISGQDYAAWADYINISADPTKNVYLKNCKNLPDLTFGNICKTANASCPLLRQPPKPNTCRAGV